MLFVVRVFFEISGVGDWVCSRLVFVLNKGKIVRVEKEEEDGIKGLRKSVEFFFFLKNVVKDLFYCVCKFLIEEDIFLVWVGIYYMFYFGILFLFVLFLLDRNFVSRFVLI